MYKLLIFDADHTLFDFDDAEINAIKSVLKDAGINFSVDYFDIYKKINHALWADYELGKVNQDEIKYRRFRDFLKSIGSDYDFKLAAEDYLVYLSKGTRLLDGAGELIDNLGKDHILGLLTNGISKVQHPRLEASELADSFDAVAVSGDYGISKPDPELFQILCDKAGFHDKEDMLVIGDSLTSDMLGGINFGIDTCWYNPGKKTNKSEISPKYEISELRELYTILERE